MTREQAKAFVDSVVKLRNLANDEQAAEVPHIYPLWKPNLEYSVNDKVLYNNILYKVLQQHTSQINWTPTDAPSLFSKVLVTDSNLIPMWEQPDSTNAYTLGDRVMHNGSIWVSEITNNVWEPGVYGWIKT